MKHAVLDEIFGPYWIGQPLPGGGTWPRERAIARGLYEYIWGAGVPIPGVPHLYLEAIDLYEEDPIRHARRIWRTMLPLCGMFDPVEIEAAIRASAQKSTPEEPASA